MPLIHVYHPPAKPAYLKAISDGLHQALLETWAIPEKDRFQIFHEKAVTELQIDQEMWDVPRSDDTIVFHIFTSPRTAEMKLALYERLPQILADKGMRPEDVFISVSSNQREDWSFGNGRAHLLDVDAGLLDHLSPALGGPKTSPVAQATSLGGQRSLTTLAGTRSAQRLPSVAAASMPRMARGGSSATSKLALIAACGASAFFGTLAAQQH